MTPTIILIVMTLLLVWSSQHVGVTSSISNLFYHNKTKKAFKAALWLCGSLLVLHAAGDPTLTLGGLSLIGVPIFGDYENKKDLTLYAHYILAASFFTLTALYISPWMLAMVIGGAGVGYFFIKRNRLYWLEVIGIIFLISGFYIF